MRWRVPNTLVLLFAMITLALLATYIVPKGTYQMESADGHDRVVAGTFEYAKDPEHVSPLLLFTAIPVGFAKAQGIIFFCFIIGGALAVIRSTGAIDALLGLSIRTFARSSNILIAATILLFTIGSSTLGMAEEYLPFVPLLIALALGLGLDTMTAIGIMCIGYSIGYGCAAMNPFTLINAQVVAELPPASGAWYRLVLTVPFFILGVHHVLRYAARVRRDPAASLVADVPAPENIKSGDYPAFTGRHVVVLSLLVAAIGLVVWGISAPKNILWVGSQIGLNKDDGMPRESWYLTEIGAVFLGLAVATALVARISPDTLAETFGKGALELTNTALLIGFARTIEVVLTEGQIIHTIVHGVAGLLEGLGPELAAIGMFFFQSLCNFFIPSGSGQAFVTMPLMAPVADLTNVSRQTAVLAYQFGDGFTNILVPTNAVLMGILAMARIPYDRWLRFVLPFMVKVWILGSLAMAIAVWIGY